MIGTCENGRGFSLVELSVSTAVLTLFMITLVQLTGAVSNTWREGAARANNLTQARAVLGLLERDMQSMVLRSDLAAFVDEKGDPACAFYSRVQGGNGDRRVSLVKYAVDTDTSDNISGLARFDYGLNYDPTQAGSRTLSLATTDRLPDLINATQEEFAPGVIAIGFQFVDGEGILRERFHFNFKDKEDIRNTRTVLVSLAVLDNHGFDLAVRSGKLERLVKTFETAPSSAPHARNWTALVGGGHLPNDIPKPVRAGIRVFEQSIALPCP